MFKLHKMPVVVGLLGLLACALLLEWSVDAGLVMQLVVPRPSDTILAFPEVQADMDLIGNFLLPPKKNLESRFKVAATKRVVYLETVFFKVFYIGFEEIAFAGVQIRQI